MKCETCLYNKNCQYLLKHPTHIVKGCTAYKDATNFVEVVRCKDCRWAKHEMINKCENYICKCPFMIEDYVNKNFYCGYGERKGMEE